MKKTAAFLAAVACTAAISVSAFAVNGTTRDNDNNIVDDVLNGAEDVVSGVVNGVEDVVTPGQSTSVNESTTTNNNVTSPNTTSGAVIGESTSVPENVNTGVPALELAALGTAAVGGLAAMAITIRKKK